MHYEFHEMALQFPAQSPEEKAQLRENMIQRVQHGLAPLESPLLLVEGKIADGRHRYQVWQELATEGACDGYFAINLPPVENSGANENNEEDSEAAVLLCINSRNLCQRTLSADRKAAIFLKQMEQFPSLKLTAEKIRNENQERMKAGKPLDDKSQGKTTNEKLGELAGGVSGTTMKNVKAVQKKVPQLLDEVANGTISAKAALKKVAVAKRAEKPKSQSVMPPNSPPNRQPARESGSKPKSKESRKVVLRLKDTSKVAHFNEFLEEAGISARSESEGESTVLQFNATGQEENDLLMFLGSSLAASGPVNLEITLSQPTA